MRIFHTNELSKQPRIIIDSPGIKDNRSLEIDITNNLNIMEVLKKCNSVRFLFLVNYHEFKAEKGSPFIETALIFAKILNGNNFENNLKSLSVFYSHATGVTIQDIYILLLEMSSIVDELKKYS